MMMSYATEWNLPSPYSAIPNGLLEQQRVDEVLIHLVRPDYCLLGRSRAWLARR
jgi:hypothetical protein